VTPVRYLVDDEVGAAEGLALDEALMAAHHRRGEDAPTALRLYTYRSHAALCGRFQNLEAEIDVAACQRTGTDFNRRPTGGGAIVMGSGQLGVAVATSAPTAERPKQLLMRFSEGIVAGLARLGIEAVFGGKNDLVVDGRKVAGLGLYLDGAGGLLFHSSILADLDIPFMLEVLDIPAAKLGERAVGAVEERVTTVGREVGRTVAADELRAEIAAGFASALGWALEPSAAGDEERAIAADLRATKYDTAEWLFQRAPRSDGTGSAMVKTPEGLVRLYVALQGDTIKSALFTGDFNQIPDPLSRFESALKWSRLDEGLVSRLAAEACSDGTGLGVEPSVLVGAVMAAGANAERKETAAPQRDGSCYFPEMTA
jgi:lipoate-protein ligase A